MRVYLEFLFVFCYFGEWLQTNLYLGEWFDLSLHFDPIPTSKVIGSDNLIIPLKDCFGLEINFGFICVQVVKDEHPFINRIRINIFTYILSEWILFHNSQSFRTTLLFKNISYSFKNVSYLFQECILFFSRLLLAIILAECTCIIF